MSPMALAAFWAQSVGGDIRNVSWWLPHGPSRDLIWMLVFVANLTVLLYYLHKLLFRGKAWSVPIALRGRGQSIAAQLAEAERARQAAEQRLAAIEARIANLPAELRQLETEAGLEAAREFERILGEGGREAERIARVGRDEIEAAGKLAQKELKGLAAALALELATRRIQAELTAERDQAIVTQAVSGLAGGRAN